MITQIDLDKDSIIFNPSQVIMFNKVFEEGENGLVLNSNKYHEFAHFGAFRCGKSYEMQLIAFLLAIYYKRLRILYVRSTYDQLIDSVISQMNHDFGKYSQYKYFSSKRDALFYRTNSQISFRAFDVDTKILSNEYDAIFLCQGEELKEAFFLQLFGRLSGGNLPKACLFLEGNPSNNFVKRRYKDRTAEELDKDKIIFVESGTAENQKHIPEDYIERLKANYPASWINRYVYGGWDQIDEMVFSEFRENLHVIDPLTIEECKLFKVIQGFDYGWINETAIVWCYVDYDGNLTIFEEWGGSYKYNDEISENALKYGKFKMMADFGMKQQINGKSVWTDLSKTLWLSECNKNQRDNIVTINKLFKKRSIRITRNCVKTIQQIKNTKWKTLKLGSTKNHPEEIDDKDTDFFDALTYVVIAIAGKKTQTEEEKRYPRTIAAATHRRDKKDGQLF